MDQKRSAEPASEKWTGTSARLGSVDFAKMSQSRVGFSTAPVDPFSRGFSSVYDPFIDGFSPFLPFSEKRSGR
jgi:hypothetical protein